MSVEDSVYSWRAVRAAFTQLLLEKMVSRPRSWADNEQVTFAIVYRRNIRDEFHAPIFDTALRDFARTLVRPDITNYDGPEAVLILCPVQ